DVFGRLEAELSAVLMRKGYQSIQECRGRLNEL
ncbi:MAG: dihydroorotate oxidase, partial [Nitrospira sp. WS238]|nr:dihydroorotate oxidase [Nitrospira sp. WS238]